MQTEEPINIEPITFLYDLCIESRWLGPFIYDHINERINQIMMDDNYFAKAHKGQILVKLRSIKPANKARVTNVQSDNIVRVEIEADCINPQVGKVLTGRVIGVGTLGNNQAMYMVSVEDKAQIFITSPDKNLLVENDRALVKVKEKRYSKDGKLIILGTFVKKL